jgi:hypothetical protein
MWVRDCFGKNSRSDTSGSSFSRFRRVVCEAVRHEDGLCGFLLLKEESEHLRHTGAASNPGQRDAIVSLTAAAIGVCYAFPMPWPLDFDGSLPAWWRRR